MTDLDATSPEAIEADLTNLAAVGIGCPSAVKIKGPAAVREWIDAEYLAHEERVAAEDAGDAGETTGEFLDRKLQEDHGADGAEAAGTAEALADVVEGAQAPPGPVEDPQQTMATLEEVLAAHDRVTELDGRLGAALEGLADRVLELEEPVVRFHHIERVDETLVGVDGRLEGLSDRVESLEVLAKVEAAPKEPTKGKRRGARGK